MNSKHLHNGEYYNRINISPPFFDIISTHSLDIKYSRTYRRAKSENKQIVSLITVLSILAEHSFIQSVYGNKHDVSNNLHLTSRPKKRNHAGL